MKQNLSGLIGLLLVAQGKRTTSLKLFKFRALDRIDSFPPGIIRSRLGGQKFCSWNSLFRELKREPSLSERK
jgi:hypothetical protein